MKINNKLFQIANRFGIQVKQIHRIQAGVYRVTATNDLQYCLKLISFPTTRVKWMDHTLRKLAKHGFSRIAWRDPNTISGQKLFIKLNPHSHYVLMPWLSGRWPSPTSLKDMYNCGKVLARFHMAGQKIPTLKSGAVNLVGEWPALFRGFANRLQRKTTKAQHNGHRTGLDEFLQINGNEIIRKARKAKRILQNSAYSKACLKAKKMGVLCHGDGGPTNFIIDSKDTYLIDFETLRYDLRSYDLYRILYNSCKDYGWKIEIAEAILDGYHSVSKLYKLDIRLLSAWLRFPRRICEALDLYDSLTLSQKVKIEDDIKRYFKEDRKITSFIQQLDTKGKYQ